MVGLPNAETDHPNGSARAITGRERGAVALAFCVTAARGVLDILHGEIVDMNGPPIACGTSYDPVAFGGKALTSLNMDGNFPV